MFSRRHFLGTVAVGSSVMAGCVGLSEPRKSDEKKITEFVISMEHGHDNSPFKVSVQPEGPVAGFVGLNVGDVVSFRYKNELDDAVGIHDHLTESELEIEPNDTAHERFGLGKDDIGRHEVEAWVAGGSGHEGHDHDHGHEVESHVILVVEVKP